MRSEPYITPSSREITRIYDTSKDSIIRPSINESLDIATRANVFTRVAKNIESPRELVSTYINDSIESPISTVRRGRRIVDYDEIDEMPSQSALDEHVRRLTVEATSAFTHLTFNTALMPHGGAETLLCNFPEVFDAPLKFHETSWEMPLGYNGVMRHEARKVVRL